MNDSIELTSRDKLRWKKIKRFYTESEFSAPKLIYRKDGGSLEVISRKNNLHFVYKDNEKVSLKDIDFDKTIWYCRSKI